MKIAIWIYRLGGGGAERVVTNLASGFVQKGTKVSVLVHTHDNPYAVELDERVELKCLENVFSKYLKPRTLFCLFGLAKYLKSEKPDVVFTTGAGHSILLLLLRILLRLDTKIVIRETNTQSVQVSSSSFLYKAVFALAKILYPHADRVVTPSNGVADDLKARIKKIKNDKLTVIYNPIHVDFLRERGQEELDCNDLVDKDFILSVGRLVPQKGFDILIQAWAPITKKTNIPLVILGEGLEREKLETLAEKLGVSKNLYLLGFNQNPFRYMAKAKLYVLSSYFEGLPNALLQAIACGSPVVSMNCPSGPNEILKEGKLAPLVPVADVEALNLAMDAQLKGKGTQQEKFTLWGEIGDLYHIETISNKYLQLFEGAVKDS